MAGEQKMLPPKLRIDWLEGGPGTFADIDQPTVEELTNAVNISCAVSQNNLTLGFTASDTNDEKSVCDTGNVATPTYTNHEVNLTFFRDADIENNESVFNEAYELFKTPYQLGYVIQRVGYLSSVDYADGQDVQIFAVMSDLPTSSHNAGEPIKMVVPFLQQGTASNGFVTIGGAS